MEISAALTADIDDLCTSVGSDPERVVDPLAALNKDLRLAVRSYLGLQLVLADRSLSLLTAFTPLMQVEKVATSLYVPLALLDSISNQPCTAEPPSTSPEPELALTLYAGLPGAFVELARDLTDAMARDRLDHSSRASTGRRSRLAGGLLLDRHLRTGQVLAGSCSP